MNDCGTVLHESEEFAQLTFAGFRDLYKPLWKKTISMCSYYLHGDALLHNIVYNSETKQLVLIDLDEGTRGTKAHKRVIRATDGHCYPYVRYPNFLRAWKNRERYTQLQLAATFLQITRHLFANQITNNMEAVASAANTFLEKKNDADPMMARDTSVEDCVKQLILLVEECLLLDSS